MLGRKTAAEIADPQLPPFPFELRYLWDWYIEHSWGLAQNGMGPAVVTWESLRAWSEFMRVDLDPWEARTLVMLGHLRATIEAEAAAKEAQRK